MDQPEKPGSRSLIKSTLLSDSASLSLNVAGREERAWRKREKKQQEKELEESEELSCLEELEEEEKVVSWAIVIYGEDPIPENFQDWLEAVKLYSQI